MTDKEGSDGAVRGPVGFPFRVLVHDNLPPDVIVTLPAGMSDELMRMVAVKVAQRAASAASVASNPTPIKSGG